MSAMKCNQCGSDYKVQHWNSRYCEDCRYLRRKKNIGFPASATKAQIAIVKAMVGDANINEIAALLGVHRSFVKRIGLTLGLTFRIETYSEETIREVTEYYLKHGKPETEKMFPNVAVRTIIEHKAGLKGLYPRCRKWTDAEMVELAKFAGLVSFNNQAKYFNRPRANAGSIKSAWCKRFKTAPGYMHGLPIHKAKILLMPGFPTITVQEQERGGERKMVLFCDAVKYLAKDTPDFIKDAIKAMAEFQRKLYGKNPRLHIENILAGMDYAK